MNNQALSDTFTHHITTSLDKSQGRLKVKLLVTGSSQNWASDRHPPAQEGADIVIDYLSP